jgi:hypothetical protein
MHAFTGCRVEKFQYPGMKPETAQRIGCRPVFFVTGNAVTYVLKMNPYLIFSAGL